MNVISKCVGNSEPENNDSFFLFFYFIASVMAPWFFTLIPCTRIGLSISGFVYWNYSGNEDRTIPFPYDHLNPFYLLIWSKLIFIMSFDRSFFWDVKEVALLYDGKLYN